MNQVQKDAFPISVSALLLQIDIVRKIRLYSKDKGGSSRANANEDNKRSVIREVDCEDNDQISFKPSHNKSMFRKKFQHDSSENNCDGNLLAHVKEDIEEDEDLLPPSDSNLAGLVNVMY